MRVARRPSNKEPQARDAPPLKSQKGAHHFLVEQVELALALGVSNIAAY